MPNTANRNYPYPAATEAADVPLDMQQLAEAIDTDMQPLKLDTGWQNITGHTMASGWTATGASLMYRILFGKIVCITGNLIIKAATPTMNVSVNGGLPNTPVMTLPAFLRPIKTQGLGGYTGGRTATWFVETTGEVIIAATAPDATQTAAVAFPTGEEVSFAGIYFLG
jgi:hypothetical protein